MRAYKESVVGCLPGKSDNNYKYAMVRSNGII